MDLKKNKRKEDYDPAYEEEQQEEKDQEGKGSGKKIAILAGAGVLAAALLIAGCVKGCGSSNKKDSPDSMQAVFEQYLDEDGNALDALDSLSEADQQRVISTAISTLEKLIGDGSNGYDRETVVSELEKVLNDMNLGLPETTIHTIAEKLVELYTNSYNEVYSDVEKTNSSIKHLGDTVTKQMQENLYTITDYLTQLDSEIVMNQTTLEEVLNSSEEISSSMTELHEKTDSIRNQMNSSLSEIKNEFGSVNAQLTQAQEKLDAYYAKYDKNSETINTGITNIQAGIKSTQDQIAVTQQKITDTLTEMENKNVTRQNEINKKFTDVESSIKATQEQLTKVEKSVLDTLSDMDKDMQGNHRELVEILDDMETDLQKTLSENMVAIDDHFTSLQKSVDASFAQLQENIDISVMELKGQMDDIHAQILTTQAEITDVLNAMDEKRDLQYEDIMNAINDAVASINAEMENAYSNLEALILQMKADGEADHAETLETLQGMESSLAASMENSLDQINTSFADLNTSLAQYFTQMKEEQGAGQEELGNAIGKLGDNLKENQQVIRDELAAHDRANTQGQNEIRDAIKNHDANMVAGHEGLNSAIGTHNENVHGYIESLKSFLGEKLDQVFTYVSNGKKRMASALLTKGVSINEDATFAEFAEAILNIPQKLVIGVQEIPGEIEYDYHYHTDASGNRVGEVKTNDKKGGCYTVPVYHTHGDSCYNWSHEHTDDCDKHTYWVDWNPSSPEGYWATSYTCGDQPANVRGSLKCSLPSSSDGKPIYYELGCGLADGQIIGAHIVYNHGSVGTARLARVIEPEAGEIKASGVVNEPEYPEPVESESTEESGEEVYSTEAGETGEEEDESVSETESTSESEETSSVEVQETSEEAEDSEEREMEETKETEYAHRYTAGSEEYDGSTAEDPDMADESSTAGVLEESSEAKSADESTEVE